MNKTSHFLLHKFEALDADNTIRIKAYLFKSAGNSSVAAKRAWKDTLFVIKYESSTDFDKVKIEDNLNCASLVNSTSASDARCQGVNYLQGPEHM